MQISAVVDLLGLGRVQVGQLEAGVRRVLQPGGNGLFLPAGIVRQRDAAAVDTVELVVVFLGHQIAAFWTLHGEFLLSKIAETNTKKPSDQATLP